MLGHMMSTVESWPMDCLPQLIIASISCCNQKAGPLPRNIQSPAVNEVGRSHVRQCAECPSRAVYHRNLQVAIQLEHEAGRNPD